VVEMGVVSQPGADAERYRCACLRCTQGLTGRGDGGRVQFEYASTVWDPHTCRNIYKLQQVRRHSDRCVTGNRDYKRSATRMVQDLGWPTLEQRRRNRRLTIMYKICNHQVDTDFSSQCSLSPSIIEAMSLVLCSDSAASCAAYSNSFYPRTRGARE